MLKERLLKKLLNKLYKHLFIYKNKKKFSKFKKKI